MSSRKRELLTQACAVCGEPVETGKGILHLSFRDVYGVHHGECRERFETAVAEALARIQAAPPQRRLWEESPAPRDKRPA